MENKKEYEKKKKTQIRNYFVALPDGEGQGVPFTV